MASTSGPSLPPAQTRRLKNLLRKLARKRVLVYGDMVCDAYHHTTLDRISREAPVLIVRHQDREYRAGGAANAARNVASMGGRTLPVGFLGGDEEGKALRRLLIQDGSADGGLLVRRKSSTPVKTRILASAHHGVQQQVLRIDRAEPFPESRSARRRLQEALDALVGQAHAVLVSDYGLGTVHTELVARLFESAAARKVPRVLDSRHRLQAFPGASLAAPNEPEMEELAGRPLHGDPKALREAGRELMKRLDLEALIVTQGSEGMTVLHGEGKPVRIPIFGTDEVADVTGAGDTVAATLALALAAGADPVDAARLATVAAGLAVMKQGTSTVSSREIRRALD